MPSHIIWPFVFLQIATVVAIVFFLRMLLHKQLEIGMSRIKKLDRENLQKEAELNEQLAKLNREYDERIRTAEEHAESLVASAKEETKKMREDEREKAKEEARRIIASALSEKENVLKDSQKNLQMKAIEASEAILRQIFSNKELSGLRQKATKIAMQEFLGSENIINLFKENSEAEVITAGLFDKKDKEGIEKDIEKKSGNKINIKFSEDKEILGGIIIKVGGRIIDGGLYSRIAKVVMEMKENV